MCVLYIQNHVMPMIVVRQSIILLFSFFIVVVLNWHVNLEHSHGCDELLVVGTVGNMP